MSIDADEIRTTADDVDEVALTVTGVTEPSDLDAEEAAEAAAAEAEKPSGRLAVAGAFPVIAAGIMVGGVFTGVGARVYAILAGLLGIGLALAVARMQRRPLVGTALIV